MTKRIEEDSMGPIEVNEDRLWGAQTQRSLNHFSIGREHMPEEIIHAYSVIKEAAATVNAKNKSINQEKSNLIKKACQDIRQGKLTDHFPLYVWQTGSGTQTHMNVNEVIANHAAQQQGMPLGGKKPLHPNDDIYTGQSSNDTFPTAMHIAVCQLVCHQLLPALHQIKSTLAKKINEFDDIIKIGRTHLQDAVPLTLGQSFSSYYAQIEDSERDIFEGLERCYRLAIGGSAVGTGLNTPKQFKQEMIDAICNITSLPFEANPNAFSALSAHHEINKLNFSLTNLASSLSKMANDIRYLASGPRAGLGELILPQNEPGSSIMPGKVNPTQCEALTMIAAQVMGNSTTINIAASQGQFELNVYKPVIAHNIIQSLKLLSDGVRAFDQHCLQGIQANKEKINQHVQSSLMLVTALNSTIGYDQAAKVAKQAHQKNITLKEACLAMNLLDEATLDRLLDPSSMVPEQDDDLQ